MALTFYRWPRFLLLFLGLIAVSGLAALTGLPRLEDPTLSPRFSLVKTAYAGASAERVESQVTKVLEDEISEVAELREIRSNSRAGYSVITLELADDVTDLEAAWTQVRQKIDLAEARLPQGTGKPELEKQDVRAYALILGLVWKSPETVNHAVLKRLGEQLEDRLLALPGTEKREFFGQPDEEVTITLEQRRLTALGLSVAQVAEKVARSEARLPSGAVRGPHSEMLLELNTEFDSLARLRRLPVVTAPRGGQLELQEIARVDKGIRRPTGEQALVGGQTGLVLAVYCESDYRVDLWTDQVDLALAEFSSELPPGVELEVLFRQGDYVQRRLQTLMFNLAAGAAAVMVVVLLIMGWRSALVVGSALPLTFALALTAMSMTGIPIHQMSVTGLIIAIGLLIDNAIVVTDEMQQELEAGHSPEEAIAEVQRRLTVPLASSTATTIFAFLPIALLPGGTGEFVGSIAKTVIMALVASLALSLTVLPTLLLWLNRGAIALREGSLTSLYRRLLGHLFRRPLLVVIVCLALSIAAFGSAAGLKEQFFPPTDRDQFRLLLELPAHTAQQATGEMATKVRQHCLQHPRVREVHWFLGRSVPKFYYNILQNRERETQLADGLVILDSAYGSGQVITELQQSLNRTFPEARIRAVQLEQGPPFEAPVELHLFAADLDLLQEAGEQVRAQLARFPEVVQTRASLSEGATKLQFQLDEQRARRAGLDPAAVATALQAATEGVKVGHLRDGGEELPVRVRLQAQDRQTVESLDSFHLQTAEGSIHLASLGSMQLRSDRSIIPRRQRLRVNTVQAFLEAGVLPTTVLEPLLAELKLPNGVTYEVGGEAAQRNRAVGNLVTWLLPLVTLMLGSLVVAFRSFRLAGLVALVGALSAGPGLGALYLLGIPFGFMAIIGCMGLLGVAINDTTVVLAALLDDERAKAGDAEATVEVVIKATRHVVATTLTTIAGFLPLLLGADRFWHPLAATIAGGVAGATLLALLFAPAAFLLLRRLPSPLPAN